MTSSPRQGPLKSALKHHNQSSPSSSPSATASFKTDSESDSRQSTSTSTSNIPDVPATSSTKSSSSSNQLADNSFQTTNTVTFGDDKPWVMVENVDKNDNSNNSNSLSTSPHHRPGLFHKHHHQHHSNSSSRATSPPPPTLPSTYERKVGFDTMPDADDTVSHTFSFTLQARSKGYRRSNNTRTFMCAVDGNHYSERALEWLVEELCEDGDEIVALRVLEGEADEIDQDEAREEARDLLASIVDLNEEVGDRKISIIVEFIAGRITSTIIRLIHMYRPDSLTVGTRGKSTNALQRVLGSTSSMGSVSRDVLSRSPVPVVVVRPTAKVKKHLKKRQADPKRRSYHDLIRLTQQEHHHSHKTGSNHLSTAISNDSKQSTSDSHPLSTVSSADGEGILRNHSPLPMSVSRSKRESLGLNNEGTNVFGIAEGLKSGVGHLGKVGTGYGGVKLRDDEKEKR